MNACRKKGRVVLIGDVGLDLNRADFYEKELDFLVSCSYGPGRYDSFYEEEGNDYPLPYVRWTENRNMQAYIQLLAAGKIRFDGIYEEPLPIERAETAYEALKGGRYSPLMALLSYPTSGTAANRRRIELKVPAIKSCKIRVALVGASNFAQGVHLPNLAALYQDFELRAVMSRTGANARSVAVWWEAAYCTTDSSDIFNDPDVDLVLVATRHDLHGRLLLGALEAGKHVFVEKPMTLSLDELASIETIYFANPQGPLLMTGFNRRFSPAVRHIQSLIAGRATPLIVNYRMNAGFVPAQSWLHGPEGGGRNLGEACHIYDLFNALVDGAAIVAVQASAIDPKGAQWHRNDNFAATLKYADGSVCSLTYTAMGAKGYPKERMEIFFDGKVVSLDDYKRVEVLGCRANEWRSRSPQKGHLEEFKALADTLLRGKPWPIPLADQIQATRVAFEIERQIGGDSVMPARDTAVHSEAAE